MVRTLLRETSRLMFSRLHREARWVAICFPNTRTGEPSDQEETFSNRIRHGGVNVTHFTYPEALRLRERFLFAEQNVWGRNSRQAIVCVGDVPDTSSGPVPLEAQLSALRFLQSRVLDGRPAFCASLARKHSCGWTGPASGTFQRLRSVRQEQTSSIKPLTHHLMKLEAQGCPDCVWRKVYATFPQ